MLTSNRLDSTRLGEATRRFGDSAVLEEETEPSVQPANLPCLEAPTERLLLKSRLCLHGSLRSETSRRPLR